MKNILNGINIRLDTAEEKNSELEDLVMGTMQGVTQKKIYFLKRQSIRELWDIQQYKTCVFGFPEGEVRKVGLTYLKKEWLKFYPCWRKSFGIR